MKTTSYICILVFVSTLLSVSSTAEVKIIAHSSVKDTSLSKEVAADIFLGKLENLPSGTKAIAIDQEIGEDVRDEFYQKIANKNAAQLKAYWSRLIFTGQGLPPKQVLDDDEVLELVSDNPNLIGYVSGDTDTMGTKVLLSVP